jgi:hypothetical protein
MEAELIRGTLIDAVRETAPELNTISEDSKGALPEMGIGGIP